VNRLQAVMRTRIQPVLATCVVFSLFSALACSSQYRPAKSAHVAKVVRDGAFVHMRDGIEYRSAIDGGLRDAVEGNPRATEEAKTFVRDMYIGLGGVLGGFILMGGAVAAAPRDHRPFHWDARTVATISLASTGFVAYLTGLGYLVAGQPHAVDAVNIYNDDVDAKLAEQFRQQLKAAVQAERERAAREGLAPVAPNPNAPNSPPALPAVVESAPGNHSPPQGTATSPNPAPSATSTSVLPTP